MTGELESALNLAEIAAHPGRHRRPLHQPGYLLVVQPLRPDSFPASSPGEKGAHGGQLSELDPSLDCRDRAGNV